MQPLTWHKLAPIVHEITQFLLADPVGFDEIVPNSLLSVLLRVVGNQFPFKDDRFGQQARSLILYIDLPKQLAGQKHVPAFDFAAAFERINMVSVSDFIDIGFVVFAGAHANCSFSRDYFETARRQGMLLPNDERVVAVLNQLAADPGMFKTLYNKYRQPDRRFAAYDYNPLFPYPIIRPWRQEKWVTMEQDRMVAPLPGLILWRISTGIYYQMRDCYEDFTSYFGHIFEACVGKVLGHCVPQKNLISEHGIRMEYPASAGKSPDWIVVEGDTAILIECKATKLSRLALATGGEDAIESSIGQIKKGLHQLHEFIQICQAGNV